LCVIFRLFHFHISIKVPKQHSRQCKSQFDLAVMEEHQRNGQSDLCIQLGLEKVSKLAITIILFLFFKEAKTE
jgi:hypothetical protein